jgi:hypothetical protein
MTTFDLGAGPFERTVTTPAAVRAVDVDASRAEPAQAEGRRVAGQEEVGSWATR